MPKKLIAITSISGTIIGLDVDGITLWAFVPSKGWTLYEKLV